jgi:hypothetical protein
LVFDSESGGFSPGKEIKGLRGGVHRYAAQARPKIDAARGEKHPFRTETNYIYSASTFEILIVKRFHQLLKLFSHLTLINSNSIRSFT